MAATGIAVTVWNAQLGRSSAFFTGGDGMYYLTVPAGAYNLEIWLSRQTPAPTLVYNIFVSEPMTDIPQIFVNVCFAQ